MIALSKVWKTNLLSSRRLIIYDLSIAGETWEDLSYAAMVEASSHGWMYASPDTQMCRGALYDSAFAAAGVPIYDSSLYEDSGILIGYEKLMRITRELQLYDSSAAPQKPPTAPVTVKNPDNINANKFLLELKNVPEDILAEFNLCG